MRSNIVPVLCCALSVATTARGQTIAPYYDQFFTIENLGSAPGVPLTYGGISFKAGAPNTLLLGGHANESSAGIFAVPVLRDPGGHVVGFAGPAVELAAANGIGQGGIDGSLLYLPGNVLAYTSFPDNALNQIRPGGAGPDKQIALEPLGVIDSVGGFAVVPQGFPGAGRLKLLSYYLGHWYDAELVPDGSGTFDVAQVASVTPMGAGPESIAYVKGDEPGFVIPYILVAKYDGGRIDTYDMDDNGDPIIATEYPFVNGIFGAEGMAFDPVSGDLLISTFDYLPYGGNEILVVRGFNTPEFPCVGDFDGNGVVDAVDLGVLLGAWGSPAGDLDSDGTTGASDLAILLGAWGPCS